MLNDLNPWAKKEIISPSKISPFFPFPINHKKKRTPKNSKIIQKKKGPWKGESMRVSKTKEAKRILKSFKTFKIIKKEESGRDFMHVIWNHNTG